MADPSISGPAVNFNNAQMQLLLNVPVVHVTGMHNSFGNTGDLTSVLSTNGRPAVVLNMNMMAAKSYAHLLMDIVAQYEAMTGSTLDTMEKLQERFERFNEREGGR